MKARARLLLDEMIGPRVAHQLQQQDLDVRHASTDTSLRGLSEEALLEQAQRDRRVLVTRNLVDFERLDQQWQAAGREHAGLVMVPERGFVPDRRAVGALVHALAAAAQSGLLPTPGGFLTLQPGPAAQVPTVRVKRGGATEQPTKPRTRSDIQGLRAVAVLLVISNHLFGRPTGGFVGVDVFFVISGYLITGLLVREAGCNGRPSLREFYARRIRRILPLAVLVLVTTNLLSRVVFATGRAAQTQTDSLWALLFGANLHFSAIGTDYFQQHRPPSPVQHYWSLSVEEQFYAVWPMLVVGAYVAARRWRHLGRPAILAVALGGSVASFVYGIHLTVSNAAVAYFSTPARAWELGVGALLVLAQGRLSKLPTWLRTTAAWLGLFAIAAAAALVDSHTALPAAVAALPVLGAGLILAADDPASGPGAIGLLSNRVTRYLGDISYSLYLWHFPCIVLAEAYFGSGNVWYYTAGAVLPVGLSVLSYTLLEEPVRKSRWLSKKPVVYEQWNRAGRMQDNERKLNRLIVGSVGIVGFFAAVALRVPQPVYQPYQPTELILPSAAGAVSPLSSVTPVRAALGATEWPKLKPPLDSILVDGPPPEIRDGCFSVPDLPAMRRCSYGDREASKTAFILGDSIAASYVQGVRSALGAGWRVQFLTLPGCPEIALRTPDLTRAGGGPYPACYQHRDFVLNELRAERPDLTITASLSPAYVNNVIGEPTGLGYVPSWQNAERKILAELRPFTTKLVVLGGPPGGANLQTCAPPRRRPTDCITSVSSLWLATSQAESAAAKRAGALYVNPINWFCEDGYCPAFVGTTPVYWDGIHLTGQFARALGQRLRAALGA